MKKTIILDTNVYLTEAGSILSFGKDNIAIPTIVLDEIDKHKHRQDTAGLNARTMNRVLDALRKKGSLMDEVALGRGKGKVFAAHFDEKFMPPGMNQDDSDNKNYSDSDDKNDSSNDKNNIFRDSFNYNKNEDKDEHKDEHKDGKSIQKDEHYDDYNELSDGAKMLKRLEMLRKLGYLSSLGVDLTQNYHINSDYFAMKYEGSNLVNASRVHPGNLSMKGNA